MNNNIVVERFKYKDKASSYNRSFWQLLFTQLFLWVNSKVIVGRNTIISPKAEFNLTDNASIIFGDNCTIKARAYFILTKPNPKVVAGNYVGVGRDCYFSIKSTLTIGDYTRIGPRVTIIDQDHSFKIDDLILNQKAHIEPISIGKDVWIGSGVTILRGVIIGDGAIIAAGAIVNKSIPANEIWGGVPAKFLKLRK